MRPEMPFLAAGGLAIAAGFVRDKKWPDNGGRALIGTLVLVIVASATSESRIAPLVRALGLLMLLISVMVSLPLIPAFNKKGK